MVAEALARDLGPKGVHVAYVVIDAVIDMPYARRRWPDLPDDFYAKPAELAAEFIIWPTSRALPARSWSNCARLGRSGRHERRPCCTAG